MESRKRKPEKENEETDTFEGEIADEEGKSKMGGFDRKTKNDGSNNVWWRWTVIVGLVVAAGTLVGWGLMENMSFEKRVIRVSSGLRKSFHAETWNVDINVVEEHGEVLGYWMRSLESVSSSVRSYVHLVHFDTHIDMMAVELLAEEKRLLGRSKEEMARFTKEILKEPGIGDFISRASFAKLIHGVTWIRSDFEQGQYNGPAPGRYRMAFGVEEASLPPENQEDQLGLGKPEERLEVEDDEAQDGDKKTIDIEYFLGICVANLEKVDFWPGILKNQIEVEDTANCVNPFSSFQSTIDLFVATVEEPYPISNHATSWILDIDLDFFASNDPSTEFFVSHGFDEEWVHRYFLRTFHCPKIDDYNGILPFRSVMLTFMKYKETLSVRMVQELFQLAKVPCKIRNEERVNQLLQEIKSFSEERMKQWDKLWFGDILSYSGDFASTFLNEDSFQSPVGRPSKISIKQQIAKVETYVNQIIAAHGNPLTVTVSRSHALNHYLPDTLAVFIQTEVFEMLTRTFVNSLGRIHFHHDVPAEYVQSNFLP